MSHNFTMPHKFLMQHLKRCPNVVHKPSVPDNNDQTHQAFMEFKEIYTSFTLTVKVFTSRKANKSHHANVYVLAPLHFIVCLEE